MSTWIRICALDEIPRLGARIVRRGERPNVAVFRTETDKLFALADRCPHRGGPLSQGIVFGERVACPLHNMCIDLDSGCAVAPDKGEVASYAVKVDAGVVYLDIADDPDALGVSVRPAPCDSAVHPVRPERSGSGVEG